MTIYSFILGFIIAVGLYDILKLGIKIGVGIYLIRRNRPQPQTTTYSYTIPLPDESIEEPPKVTPSPKPTIN